MILCYLILHIGSRQQTVDIVSCLTEIHYPSEYYKREHGFVCNT